MGAGARRAGPRGGRGGPARRRHRCGSRRRATGCRTSSTRPAGSSSGCSACRCPRASPYAGLVYHKVQDDGWTGLPLAPDEDPQTRQVHRPSTAATLNLAAVAAKGARLWEPYDEEFAASLLESARTAWAAAVADPRPVRVRARRQRGRRPVRRQGRDRRVLLGGRRAVPDHGRRRVRRRRDRPPRCTRRTSRARSAFDWQRTAALGRMDLALVPSELPDRDAVRDSVVDARRLRALPAGQGVLRAAVPAVRRPVRVGLQRDHPQQRGDPGRRRGHHGRREVPRRPRWRASTTCWAATRSTSPT